MNKDSELKNVKLLKGTFLVDVDKEEPKSKSGIIVSSTQSQKTGTVVARHKLDIDGDPVEYHVGDVVLLNTNSDTTTVKLDGKKFELCSRQNIHLILGRNDSY